MSTLKIYVILVPALLMAGCMHHPLADASDKMVSGPLGAYIDRSLASDKGLDELDRKALSTEWQAYKRLVEEANKK